MAQLLRAPAVALVDDPVSVPSIHSWRLTTVCESSSRESYASGLHRDLCSDTYPHKYIHKDIHTDTHTRAHTHKLLVSMGTCTDIHTHTNTDIHRRTHKILVSMGTCAHGYTHTNTDTYRDTFTDIHTYTQAHRQTNR